MLESFLSADGGRALRDAFGRFATGVTLITTMTEAGPLGFVANSFSSVSLDPPLVLWSPARTSRRFAAFVGARHYAIHVLSADQAAVTTRFFGGGPGFDGLDHAVTEDGQPSLPALARFDCALHAVHDGGDHAIVVGRVLRFQLGQGAPLVFWQGQYGGFAGQDLLRQ